METKLLDLNAYGVEEMSVAEMRETDGGFWAWALFGIAMAFMFGQDARCGDEWDCVRA